MQFAGKIRILAGEEEKGRETARSGMLLALDYQVNQNECERILKLKPELAGVFVLGFWSDRSCPIILY